MENDRGRRIAGMTRQDRPHIIPVDLLRGPDSLGRRGLVAGIDELLQDEEALAKGGEERMVRDDAQRGERLVAQLRPLPRGARRRRMAAAGLGVRRWGHQSQLWHRRTRRRMVCLLGLGLRVMLRLRLRLVRVEALLVGIPARGEFTVRIAGRYVTSVVARSS